MYKLSKYNVYEKINNDTVVYNRITGKLIVFKTEKDKIINRKYINDLDEKTIIKLDESKIIVSTNYKESLEYEKSSIKQRKSVEHLTLTITPSLKCNFNCTYCFQSNTVKNTMQDETIDALIAFIVEKAKKIKSLHVNWYGGEPLMFLNIIKQITKKILENIPSSVKYTASIITNGYLIDNINANDLRKLHIYWIQVTLDGDKNNHNNMRKTVINENTFDKIISNIIYASQFIFVIVRVNISIENIKKLSNLINELESLKNNPYLFVYFAKIDNLVNTCQNQCVDIGEFSELAGSLSVELDKYNINSIKLPRPSMKICMAVTDNAFVIGPDGLIYKCINTIGMTNEVIGTIFDLKNIKLSNKWVDYRFDEECTECDKLPSCNGGCPYSRFQNSHFECSRADLNLKIPIVKAYNEIQLLSISKL